MNTKNITTKVIKIRDMEPGKIYHVSSKFGSAVIQCVYNVPQLHYFEIKVLFGENMFWVNEYPRETTIIFYNDDFILTTTDDK